MYICLPQKAALLDCHLSAVFSVSVYGDGDDESGEISLAGALLDTHPAYELKQNIDQMVQCHDFSK